MPHVQPIELEYCRGSNKLYVFFAGIAAGIAMPVFEFYTAARVIEHHKIFVRDLSQCWYHVGLKGITTDINSTAEYLDAEIRKLQADEVYFVGNSMGGYASILFSVLMKQGRVIAFSPQTFISPALRYRHSDSRWQEKIWNTYKKSLFKTKAWNLRSLLTRSNWVPDISIFVSKEDPLDYSHAMHLSNLPGVKIHVFPRGGHNLVKLLRDQELLPAIMSGQYSQV